MDLDTVLLKVASRCNIDCTYCYVYQMGDDQWTRLGKFMSNETIEAVCTSLQALSKSQASRFSVVLHGGEPLLLGASRLKYLLESLRNVLPLEYPISIQTNGILITTELLDICSTFRASLSVSIDGPRQLHDAQRIKFDGGGTFDEVLRGIEMLESHSDALFLYAGLLAVVDPCSDPQEVYTFFKTIGAPSVDFLYKDGNHCRLPLSKAFFESVEYGSWMASLFNIYISDPDPIRIRILDDMTKAILGGLISKEGMGVSDFGILIIDTDGTIAKNDTLKSSFNGADRFSVSRNIRDTVLGEFLKSDEFQAYRRMQRPSCLQCSLCPELKVCGGGMTLHRWSDDNAFNNPSIYCSDQLYLIGMIRQQLAQYQIVYA